MTRRILAVAAGFVIWSALWFAANAGLGASGMLPPPGEPIKEPSALALLLLASILASLAAGFSASWLARAPGHTVALWLGVLLLGVGLLVQAQYWHLMPVWYHAAFLLLLIPVCLLGSRLRSDSSSKPNLHRGSA